MESHAPDSDLFFFKEIKSKGCRTGNHVEVHPSLRPISETSRVMNTEWKLRNAAANSTYGKEANHPFPFPHKYRTETVGFEKLPVVSLVERVRPAGAQLTAVYIEQDPSGVLIAAHDVGLVHQPD
jgi:hypothetical protein